jgi:D-serine deaminase-like pyridoxal phosphate-dependent protein
VDALSDFLARVRPPRTPALVVREAALARNLEAMQGLCDARGVRLRPHGKMHKSSAVAARQMALGAVGLCCQTVGEAEVFAAGGAADILLSAPVPAWGWAPLAALAAGGTRVAAVVDHPAQIAAAETAGARAVTLLVDVDLGQHRTGVPPADAPALVEAVRAAGFVLGGIQAYCGHLQHDLGRAEALAGATARLAALVGTLRAAGLPPAVVTGGGTGTARLDLEHGQFTELQAGSYAFMDVQYAEAGADFEPALFLAASVVSVGHKSHVTVDSGLKALSADGPAARPVAGAPEGARFRFLGDEHGAILNPAVLARLAEGGLAAVAPVDADPAVPMPAWPAPGALVWLQPGHVDPTVNLHDAFWLADEWGGLTRVAIDARRMA